MKKSELRQIIREEMEKNLSSKLADNISQVIPEYTSIIDFAKAVAQILRDEYGSHNYKEFMDVLTQEIKN
jgi:hypothetical protein